MAKTNLVDLKIDFPAEEYEYLKLASDKMGLSVNQFIVYATVKGIHKLEDDLEDDTYTPHSWAELCGSLGWEHAESFINLK